MKLKTFKSQNESKAKSSSAMDIIPCEILDLVRFLAKYVMDLHKLKYEVYKTKNVELLIEKFPILQGTKNQLNMVKIGEQEYDKKNLPHAIKWMLNQGVKTAKSWRNKMDSSKQKNSKKHNGENRQVDTIISLRPQSEIEAKLKELESDVRLTYKTATVFENAPLALIQLELESKINMLKWVLAI